MLTARFASPSVGITLSLVLTAALAGVACEGTERCWDNDSCGGLDAGTSQTASGTDAAVTQSVAQSSSASAGGTGGADTGADSAVSARPEPSAEPSSDSGLDADAGSLDGDSGTLPEAGGASSVSASAQVSVDTTSAASSAAPSSDPPDPETDCTVDSECAEGVCVNDVCMACNTENHNGCETASAGSRCLAASGGNRCVECLSSDAPPDETDACGLNDRGSEVLDCVNNAWQALDCDDPDVCIDDDTDVGTTPCGPNNAGRYLIRCEAGRWETDAETCLDDDVCINDDRRTSETECGFSGYLDELCVGGGWLTQNTCTECLRDFQFPDANLAYWVASKYFITVDPVSPVSLQFREDIGDLSLGGITDLTGVQCFKAVRELSLAKDPVADLSPISSMTWLTSLNLPQTEVADLTPLSNLTNLTSLYVNQSRVSSLDGLQSLINLTQLNASNNQIEDVSPLLPLTALNDVNLFGNYYLDCGSQAYAQLQSQVEMLSSDCP